MQLANKQPYLIQTSSRGSILIAIYIPWIIAECVKFNPVISYLTAWMGSFFVFYLTLLSPWKYHSLDRPLRFQTLRPIVLIQLVFAGFMCSTSIFYFMDHVGYEYLNKVSLIDFQAGDQTARIAKSQRIALLAHATLVAGIIVCIKRSPSLKYRINVSNPAMPFILCIIAYLLGMLASYLTGLVQFKYMLIGVSIGTSAYIFVKGLVNRKILHLIFGGCFFSFNFLSATLTGYKEGIIVNSILIAFIAFPYYKRTILVLLIPFAYLLLYILPTFTTVIRVQSWLQGKNKETAREQAYQTLLNEENEQMIADNNWDFLTNRFSETNMFTTYLKTVPDQYPYYSFDILINSFYSLIPRILWESKPSTERLAMERVYRSGAANRLSSVSAKTRPIIDGYLSAGVAGVFIYMLCYGILAQSICNLTEKLFGGYQMGCAIIFNSIFQPLWRGNALEFLLNNIFYGYLLMLIIHFVLKQTKTLQPHHEDHTHYPIL